MYLLFTILYVSFHFSNSFQFLSFFLITIIFNSFHFFLQFFSILSIFSYNFPISFQVFPFFLTILFNSFSILFDSFHFFLQFFQFFSILSIFSLQFFSILSMFLTILFNSFQFFPFFLIILFNSFRFFPFFLTILFHSFQFFCQFQRIVQKQKNMKRIARKELKNCRKLLRIDEKEQKQISIVVLHKRLLKTGNILPFNFKKFSPSRPQDNQTRPLRLGNPLWNISKIDTYSANLQSSTLDKGEYLGRFFFLPRLSFLGRFASFALFLPCPDLFCRDLFACHCDFFSCCMYKCRYFCTARVELQKGVTRSLDQNGGTKIVAHSGTTMEARSAPWKRKVED